MKDLVKAVNDAATDTTGSGMLALDEAGQRWGAYCLKGLRGRLRAKGLAISTAIAEFHDELVQRKPEEPQ